MEGEKESRENMSRPLPASDFAIEESEKSAHGADHNEHTEEPDNTDEMQDSEAANEDRPQPPSTGYFHYGGDARRSVTWQRLWPYGPHGEERSDDDDNGRSSENETE